MSEDQGKDKISLIHLGNQSLTTRSTNLVRRGLDSLKNRDGRIVHFPPDYSIGTYILKQEGEHLFPFISANQAIGDVFVPEGMRLAIKIKTDANLFALVNLDSDAPFYLDCWHVTDQSLAYLKRMISLKELYLWQSNSISNEGLAHLRELASLELLDLRYTNISDKGLIHLQALTLLKILNLEQTNIRGQGLIHLQGLTSLKKLNLSTTYISDAGLSQLQGLTSIEELNLSHNKIDGQGLIHLQGLTSLKKLNLSKTDISDAGLSQLQRLTSLEELTFSFDTFVKYKRFFRLREWLPKCQFEFTYIDFD